MLVIKIEEALLMPKIKQMLVDTLALDTDLAGKT